MPVEVLFYPDKLLNCGVLHLPSFLGERVFRLAGLSAACSRLEASCLGYTVPRAAGSEFAELHSDVLSKGKRPLLSNRIERLPELQLNSLLGIVLCARLFPICKTRSAEEVSDL